MIVFRIISSVLVVICYYNFSDDVIVYVEVQNV